MNMPVINGRGVSHHTPKKQEILQSIIQKTVNTVKGFEHYSGSKYTFNWIDAYSGTGSNPEYNCQGSSVIFKQIVEGNGVKYIAHCIDENSESIGELKASIGSDNNFYYHVGDNFKITPDIFSHMAHNSYGILYLDPNGEPNWNIPINAYNQFKLKRMDLLIHFGATSLKRKFGEDLIEHIEKIEKDYWYICMCHPIQSDAWQWAMLLGTNYSKWKGLERLGFFNIDLSKGQSIINFLNHTRNTDPKYMKKPQKPLSAFLGV